MADLDPQAKIYLETFNQMPAMYKMDPQSVREMLAQAPKPNIELEPLSQVEDRMIPVSQNDQIKIRIYTPEGQGPFPIFVYFHGGGWVLGDIESSDATCRMIANRTKSIVISVDYRLAPEHKFPIPLDDSYAALEWVSDNAKSLNGDASKIVVGGDSAGANLATVVSMMARDQKGPKIAAQILVYPVTNLNYETETYQKFAEGFGLDRELMIWFGNHYIRNEEDKKNPYVAPLLAEDLSQLPPALVITVEYDVLRDEGFAYAERLKQAGIEVEYVCETGLVHGYFTNMAFFSSRIKQTILKMTSFMNKFIS